MPSRITVDKPIGAYRRSNRSSNIPNSFHSNCWPHQFDNSSKNQATCCIQPEGMSQPSLLAPASNAWSPALKASHHSGTLRSRCCRKNLAWSANLRSALAGCRTLLPRCYHLAHFPTTKSQNVHLNIRWQPEHLAPEQKKKGSKKELPETVSRISCCLLFMDKPNCWVDRHDDQPNTRFHLRLDEIIQIQQNWLADNGAHIGRIELELSGIGKDGPLTAEGIPRADHGAKIGDIR